GDRRGRELPMHFASDFPGMGEGNGEATLNVQDQPAKLIAQFTRDENFPGPRQLVLTSASGAAETILLASVKASNLNAPFSNFGYSREDRTYPDGDIETLFIRTAEDGSRIEVNQEDFESFVEPSIKRMFATLPRTAQEIQKCSEITKFFTGLFEEGYTYDGPLINRPEGFFAGDRSFYGSPSRILDYNDEGREQRIEDPLSTLTRLVMQAMNTTDNEAIERLHESARTSEVTSAEFVRAEATRKARNMRATIQFITANAECMQIAKWQSMKFGHYFKRYSEWVSEAEKGDASEEAILHNLANKLMRSTLPNKKGPNGKSLSYSSRLEQTYRQLAMEAKSDN
ncbi:MAG: hypothetical protein AAF368_18885, partial [Planctomycetota bacterium]